MKKKEAAAKTDQLKKRKTGDSENYKNDETISFIELLKDIPYLWDVFHSNTIFASLESMLVEMMDCRSPILSSNAIYRFAQKSLDSALVV